MAVWLLVTSIVVSVSVATDLHTAASLRNKALGSGAGSKEGKLTRKTTKRGELDQQLIVCNAYASTNMLDIFHVQSMDRVTGGDPIPYKECREFLMPLSEGDQLDFKAGDADVGTFYATGLPQTSASLLLIPHRRDSNSIAMSFESHAFADLQSPQIAVVDAYRGKGKGSVKISEALQEDEKAEPVEEMLKFSSVVAVNPGNYKVALLEGSNFTQEAPGSGKPLLVEGQEKYVVMRVGIDGSSDKKVYPQELVVFPQSGSLTASMGLGVFMLCVLRALSSSF